MRELFIKVFGDCEYGGRTGWPAATNSSRGKACTSRTQPSCRILHADIMPKYISTSIAIFLWLAIAIPIEAISISHQEAVRIGNKIWQNECGGKVAGLTSWNEGEDFASLGIGHFIWYPKGARGPFEESFPKLLTFISSHGAGFPQFLPSASPSACPWNSRREFNEAQNSREMKQLRQFFVD